MVRAEIIAIGSELVLGGVADTNSLYLAEELLKLGIEVRYKTVVGDDPKDIEAALQHALGRADVVITTGGLGPTEADLTRKVVARVDGRRVVLHGESPQRLPPRLGPADDGLAREVAARVTGRRLVLHDETLQRITQQLEARHRRATAEQTTQALIPRGAKVIPNPVGTAPGFFLCFKDEGKAERALMCLPGVAMEVQHIFPEGGSVLLEALVGTAARGMLLRHRLRTFGLVESEVDARLRDLYAAERNAILGLQAGVYGVDISLTVRGRDPDSAEAVMRRMERAVRDRVWDYLYAAGDQTMEGGVALKLKAKGLTVAVAESCTGGLISQRLTSVPGSSAYFDRAVVAYSDRA